MSTRHMIALLRSHIEGDEAQFLAVAMQAAAQEARRGHTKVAQELRELIDKAKARRSAIEQKGTIPLTQPRGDLASLLSSRLSRAAPREHGPHRFRGRAPSAGP